MTCRIVYQDQWIHLSNGGFAQLIEFGIDVAEESATPREVQFAAHMKKLNDEFFCPGMGIRIEEDFPETCEQMFWCRVFYDVSRLIFDRKIGHHEQSFWQTLAIHQAFHTGLLFEYAVREVDRDWVPNTMDQQGRSAYREQRDR